jgi:Yip1 domain
MGLIERAQAILLKPKETWPVIAAEPSDAATIYRRYLVFLAAIPAVAGFIGLTLIGVSGFGYRYRLPIMNGLVQMVVGYLLSLAMVYVLALIVNALAPTFGGTKDPIAALKLVAYGSTASFVAGIFNLLPALAFVGLLGALYSIYLVYAGIAALMRCPPDKAGGYTTVVIICALLAGVVLVGVTSLFVGHGPADLGTHTVGVPGLPGGDVQIKTPDGATVTINPGAMAEMAKRMEEAGKRMESAQSSGDTAAAGKAMGDILGAVTGGGNAAPIASAELKAIGDMKRSGVEAQTSGAMGISASTAKASYGADDRRVELSIIDGGGLAGLAALAGWANMTMDKEGDGKVEKVYKDGARTIHEEYRKDGSHGEMTVVLANGVIVSAEGSRVDMATLKSTVASVDLAKIEATQRSARP